MGTTAPATTEGITTGLTLEQVTERADKYAAISQDLFKEGNFVEGQKSLTLQGDDVVYTNGEEIKTFLNADEAVDAFMA